MSDAYAQLANQIDDLRAEGDDVYAILSSLEAADFDAATSFKNWTVRDVVAHLHLSDVLAMKSVTDVTAFHQLSKDMMGAGKDMRGFAEDWLSELNSQSLLEQWRSVFDEMCSAFAAADPNVKFEWFGPGMKARMFATARQMETWAHATELYDLFQRDRTYTDRIRNVVEIGVRTFGWSYATRKLTPPGPPPRLELSAPSGALWTFNDESNDESNDGLIRGSAVEFAQVVTQVRNIADTKLDVQGSTAEHWMSIAQCFAGGPVDPPAPGSRVPGN